MFQTGDKVTRTAGEGYRGKVLGLEGDAVRVEWFEPIKAIILESPADIVILENPPEGGAW